MIIYFSGTTFNQTIENAVEETGNLIFCREVENELDFFKHIKQNIAKYESVETCIVDVSVCANTEEELLSALEMLRTMYDRMRIIVFAPYRETGDDFLTKCLHMGILDIINTNDFREIREELTFCITKGKTYRDSVKFKEAKMEKAVIKHEIRRAVHKRMAGLAGTESNIGVTHNAVVLANFLRKKGFMVALAEMNPSGAFLRIAEDFGERLFNEGYFTLNGVDFYPGCTQEETAAILSRSYNFILFDFGAYAECDRAAFERCEDRFIIAGSKPWETDRIDDVFAAAPKDVLLKYIFCFNFTQRKDQKAIREGMGEMERVYFLNYTEDPFTDSDFSGAEEIFSDCLPAREEEKKKGILHRFSGKKNKGKE